MSSTPEQRALHAQVAAYERWGRTPKAERDVRARRGQAGLFSHFERLADPDGTLPTDERARQAERLLKAHMARLALASSRARAARKAGRGET